MPLPAYKGNERYVFVCYSHADKDAVYTEIAWLQEEGINVWYDEGISAGQVWRAEIGEAISGASNVLFYISGKSIASDHCNREISLALDERKAIVPVYLEHSQLTPDLKVGLSRLQALYRSRDPAYERRLLEALGVNATLSDNSQKSAPAALSVEVAPVLSLDDRNTSQARALHADIRGYLASCLELSVVGTNESGVRKATYQAAGTMDPSGSVIVELLRASDGELVWSGRFESADQGDGHRRPATGETIGPILRNELCLDFESQQIRAMSTNLDAARVVCEALHDLHYAWISEQLSDPELIIPKVARAIELDPSLTAGYVMLAEAQLDRVLNHRLSEPLQARRSAFSALDQAHRLEPGGPMIFAARAKVHATIDLDYQSASRCVEEAMNAGPTHARAYEFQTLLADIALREGRLTEALDCFRRAMEINDSVIPVYTAYVRALTWADQPHEVLRVTSAGLSLATGGLYRLLLLDQRARALDTLGDCEHANDLIDEIIRTIRPDSRYSWASLLARIGRHSEAREHAARLEAMEHPSIGTMVYLYAYLGDLDRGFHWLKRAIECRSGYVLAALRNEQKFDLFRSDPRWNEISELLESAESQGRQLNT